MIFHELVSESWRIILLASIRRNDASNLEITNYPCSSRVFTIHVEIAGRNIGGS